MPYIEPDGRPRIQGVVSELAWLVQSPGELNFAITYLLHCLLKRGGISYTKLNELVGVLECVKAELQRRVISEYEDLKITENGDIGIL